MNDWHKLCITDSTGKEFFKVTASPMSTYSEIKNLQQHLRAAKDFPNQYKTLDVATAVILLDGVPYGQPSALDADALLAELGCNHDD